MRNLNLGEAKALHRASNFKRYQGPKIAGPRIVIDRESEWFPDALASIPDPPGALYVIGDPASLVDGLAVVGARKATPYGLSCAKSFAGRAAEKGVVIISGGALGCDAAAHEAALEAKGKTVAFLGGGCDELYPAANYGLFQRIVDGGGALVSEHSWDYPPLKHTFRARNRLIAGLARATLIVEAGLPSGTFSTADEALAANREVLVVPGSISSAMSRGANRLIFQGATPIVDKESFDDILFSLFGLLKQEYHDETAKALDEKSDLLLEALRAQPMSLEEMVSLLRSEPGLSQNPLEDLSVRLVELQRKGEVERYPNGRYGPVAC